MRACRSCGWPTSERHALENAGQCGFCAGFSRALTSQKARVAKYRNAALKEQKALAKARTEPDAKEVGRLFLRGFVCGTCKVDFVVSFVLNEHGKVRQQVESTSTTTCHDCWTVVDCVRQWQDRKKRPPCSACQGAGGHGSGKSKVHCHACMGLGRTNGAVVVGKQEEEAF